MTSTSISTPIAVVRLLSAENRQQVVPSYSSKSAIGGYFSSLIGFSLLFTVTRHFDSDSDLTRLTAKIVDQVTVADRGPWVSCSRTLILTQLTKLNFTLHTQHQQEITMHPFFFVSLSSIYICIREHFRLKQFNRQFYVRKNEHFHKSDSK